MPQQKSKKILLYFFLFLSITTLNNKNLKSFSFIELKKITVEGLDKKNNLSLVDSLNFLKFNNLLFLDEFRVKEIINLNNLVEDYSVFKKYPSTLTIKIYRTKFLAKIKKDGNNFFLGSNGKLIKTIHLKKKIPFIFGDFSIKSFFELKEAIDESRFEYKKVQNLFFFKSGRWDIETSSGLIIRLPNKDFQKSLELVVKLLDSNYEKNIYKIDLRQQNQIIINGR